MKVTIIVGIEEATHILRLREQYMPSVVRDFDEVSQELKQKLIELFGNEDTSAGIEYKIRIESSRIREGITRSLVVRINCRIGRASTEMDSRTTKWFESIVKKIQVFDVFSKTIWTSNNA